MSRAHRCHRFRTDFHQILRLHRCCRLLHGAAPIDTAARGSLVVLERHVGERQSGRGVDAATGGRPPGTPESAQTALAAFARRGSRPAVRALAHRIPIRVEHRRTTTTASAADTADASEFTSPARSRLASEGRVVFDQRVADGQGARAVDPGAFGQTTSAAVAPGASGSAVPAVPAVPATDWIARGVDLTGRPPASRSTVAGDAAVPAVAAVTTKRLVFIDNDIVQRECAIEVLDAAAQTRAAGGSRLSGATRLTHAPDASGGSRRAARRTSGSNCPFLAPCPDGAVRTKRVTVVDRQVGERHLGTRRDRQHGGPTGTIQRHVLPGGVEGH